MDHLALAQSGDAWFVGLVVKRRVAWRSGALRPSDAMVREMVLWCISKESLAMLRSDMMLGAIVVTCEVTL